MVLKTILLLFLVAAGAGRGVAAPAEPRDAVLACVQPNIAADAGDLYVACGAGETIYVAQALGGGPVSALRPIATLPGLALGRHRGPRVAAHGGTIVVAAIGKARGSATTELWAWRSNDHGVTWTGPERVTDAANAAQEGLHALAASDTTIAAAWLDTRRGRMAVFGSTSSDGRTWSPNAALYAAEGRAVCTCCHPSIALAERAATVMFRNDLDGNRDMYLKTGQGTAERLGTEHWRLDACPMDGGGLALDSQGRPVTAWRRAERVYVARPGGAEHPVGEGTDPAITMAGDTAVVAWTAPDGLAVRLGDAPPQRLDTDGSFASLASTSDHRVAIAWQRGTQSIVRLLDVGR